MIDNSNKTFPVQDAGLGLRREIMDEMMQADLSSLGFMEVAPENWLGMGGAYAKKFRQMTEQHDFVAHGLSLSIGGPTKLDTDFVKDIARFIKHHDIKCYSEHLSYCSDDGHMYDLMPIPFTEEAVHYVAKRIRQVQDIIGQRMAIENVSYYATVGQELSEIEFINAVISEADCELLLDVNNIYVNSVNHSYDATAFLKQLPGQRIAYGHIAGHYNEADDLIVDTHGADVIDSVWHLLEAAYKEFGVFPTLLERDFNIPPVAQLLDEVGQISALQNKYSAPTSATNQPAKIHA
ncbi:MAG: DUF692 domain-containing protein [Gammaproteobacteria bacterium]|nr:DUF692 domain-containing protein [Gammaproteobacteria bacterium]